MTLIPWERIVEAHRPIRELVERADDAGCLPAGEPCTRCGTPLTRIEELHFTLWTGVCRACTTAPTRLEMVFRDGAVSISHPNYSLDGGVCDPPTRRKTITYPDCPDCHGRFVPERSWSSRCETCWRRWTHGRWQHWYVSRRDRLRDIARRRFLAEVDQAAGVPDGCPDQERDRLRRTLPAEQVEAIRGRLLALHARVQLILDRWAFARGVFGAYAGRPLGGGRLRGMMPLVTRQVRCTACRNRSLLTSGTSHDLAGLPCPVCRARALTGGRIVQAAEALDADERRRLPLRIARFEAEATLARQLGGLDEYWAYRAQHPQPLDADLDADLVPARRRAGRRQRTPAGRRHRRTAPSAAPTAEASAAARRAARPTPHDHPEAM